jgi:hypothetical protein
VALRLGLAIEGHANCGAVAVPYDLAGDEVVLPSITMTRMPPANWARRLPPSEVAAELTNPAKLQGDLFLRPNEDGLFPGFTQTWRAEE